MEIKARIATTDQLKDMIAEQATQIRGDVAAVDDRATGLAQNLQQVMLTMRSEVESSLGEQIKAQKEELSKSLAAEETARRQVHETLKVWQIDGLLQGG